MTGSLDKPDPAIGYQFPSGHLGHLSPTQQTAFEAFKQLCADRGVYTPGKGDQLPSIPDHTLLYVVSSLTLLISSTVHSPFLLGVSSGRGNSTQTGRLTN